MINGKTKLTVYSENKSIYTKKITLRRGIFQGDALSALWFCVALNLIKCTQKNKLRFHYQSPAK